MRVHVDYIREVYVFELDELPFVPDKMMVYWGGNKRRTGFHPDSLHAKWVRRETCEGDIGGQPTEGVVDWQLVDLTLFGHTTRKNTGSGISINYAAKPGPSPELTYDVTDGNEVPAWLADFAREFNPAVHDFTARLEATEGPAYA